jgi:nicotinamidase-related amidase
VNDVLAEAVPYPWPYHGHLDPQRCALLVCRDRRWRVAGPAADVADVELDGLARTVSAAGGLVVVLEPTDTDSGAGTDAGPASVPGAVRVPTRGTNGFSGSPLHGVLRRAGCRDLVVAGWGLEGPVHSTLRAANDRGYECLLVPDASTPLLAELVDASCSTVAMSGGIFGAYAPAVELRAALQRAAPGAVRGPMSVRVPHPATAKETAMTPAGIHPATDADVRVDVDADPDVRVDADPYPWPCVGTLDPARTALVLIDWQVDFCGPGGYVDRMGYDLSLTRAGLGPTARVLERARQWGCTVVHTREGHRDDLADCPPNKLWRSRRIGAGIGDPGPAGRILVRGEPGWQIVPEVAPAPGELIVDKPGKGAFYATDLGLLLEVRGITHLIFTGITTDVCVHTTMRDANDRGYECLLLSDCTGATDEGNYRAALKMVTMQGGVFGSVATSEALLTALDRSTDRSTARSR